MKRIRSFFIFTALLCLTACKEDVQNTYSNYPAYFVYKNVNTVPQLNAALNSLGVYTTIRRDRDRFLFTDESGHTTPVNATAIAGNSSIQMGIAGFYCRPAQHPRTGQHDFPARLLRFGPAPTVIPPTIYPAPCN